MRSNRSKDGNSEPTVLLTGERKNRTTCVHVKGKPAYLPRVLLILLLDLILARSDSDAGFLSADSVDIWRLRTKFDAVLGEGGGKTLVETGASNEYRLTIDREELTSKIAMTSTFLEVVKQGVVPQKYASRLEKFRLSS